jgi:hypothetical protein
MSSPVRMEGEHYFFPHGYLNGWAESLIRDAQSVPSGKNNYYRIATLLSVFSFEAYLNYVGERHVAEWRKKEKKGLRSWSKKLATILDRFDAPHLKDSEPLSLLGPLFDYRNTLAHGKIALNPLDYMDFGDGTVEGDYTGDPKWYREFGQRERAVKALETIRGAMTTLHKLADPADERIPWNILGSGESTEVNE